jgi:hypothetical protein
VRIKHLCGKKGRCARHLYGSVCTTPVWWKQMCALEVIGMRTALKAQRPPQVLYSNRQGDRAYTCLPFFMKLLHHTMVSWTLRITPFSQWSCEKIEGFQARLVSNYNYNELECRHFIIDFPCNVVLQKMQQFSLVNSSLYLGSWIQLRKNSKVGWYSSFEFGVKHIPEFWG